DLPSSRLAWAGAMALFGLALVLRLWGLGSVGELIFDETYYVKDGYTLTQEGVEMSWPDEHDRVFEAGDVDTYEDSGSDVVHPSLGKWVIGAGMTLLGADSPWGWRFSVDVVCSLSLLDLPLTFFALAGFGALLIDRDRFRERLALETARLQTAARPPAPLGVSGGWRPWRLLAGLLLGMACSVKWSGLYFLAVFGIM